MNKLPIVIALVVVAIVVYASVFTVSERQYAIKFRLGEIVKSDYKPGLHWQVPFVNNVRKYDRRILTLDALPTRYLTKEKKNVNVDFFVKWKISDPTTYYKTMGGNERTAQERIYTIINDGLRAEFSNRTIQEVISGERREIMSTSTKVVNERVKEFGIEVVDVRIKRIDYEQQISDSVYRRMQAERTRVAKDLRSKGSESAEKIRAGADRKRTVLIADAYNKSQTIRGDGDAKAAEVYAKAYKKNPEFYSFYRSLEAYRHSFTSKDDLLVIEPDSEFFNYFKKSKPGK
jgi:membrane protease subunit HflC